MRSSPWWKPGSRCLRMGDSRKVIVFDEKDALHAHVVNLWKKVSKESISERGTVTVALSGGRTPIDLYRRLAREGKDFPWEKTHIFLVDERFVPRDDKDSNYRMIRETLLGSVPIPESNVHKVDTNQPGPDKAAKKYEREMVRHFQPGSGLFPRFDLIMLGLGEDGHTASLFPGSGLLQEKKRLAGPVTLDSKLHDRVTLTFPVINNGRLILFHVEGQNKAAVLKRVAEGRDPTLPASLVEPVAGELLFLADRDAAGLLSKKSYFSAYR